MVRSKRELEIAISEAPSFKIPIRQLEQYVCDSSIASELLWNAYIYGDIEDKVIVDLGCGTGILSYGAFLLGAREVFCIDIDINALHTAREFLDGIRSAQSIHYICCDVKRLTLRSIDTIVMNPPFGVHRRGRDLQFLEKAFEIAPSNIYSIHKHSLDSHKLITKLACRKGYAAQLIYTGNMSIHATYEDHVKRIHRFKVSIYRFVK
ncbi:MAG: METTL5 family protein [Ignisphaera sp.]|nr:METTL5 family protein [Ignisphaera sp.]MCX8168452.1 METTL5 family protein [Ignisphaera sp.]MDW8085108.1 METTL5 family protein [Ignisphaera sp.]